MAHQSSVETKIPSVQDASDSSATKASKSLAGSLEAATKTDEYEAEWTVKSSLQVVGGFFLLFNTYSLPLVRLTKDGVT
jgi:hypothetical protein